MYLYPQDKQHYGRTQPSVRDDDDDGHDGREDEDENQDEATTTIDDKNNADRQRKRCRPTTKTMPTDN